jgi:DNA primase small subunit
VKEIETKKFVKNKFSEYYQKHSSSLQPPTLIEKREFGFLMFTGRVMVRHKSFKNVDDLAKSLKTLVPSDVYYSSAYYERPEEEMEEKGWLGADLIFDIDADHIPTPCEKIHDAWTCSNCGIAGKGVLPEKCPACGEHRFDEKTWPCEVCLESAKAETTKLMDMLMQDFGFSPKEMKLYFSGHRGYHLHVESEKVQLLDSMARKEIVDYIIGIGLETKLHGLVEEKGERKAGILTGPSLNDPGWSGRIAKGTYEFLSAATPNDLKEIGLKKKVIDTLTQRKETILESWKEKGPWGIIKGVGAASWRKIAQHGAEVQAAKIDTVVTTDTRRLIRLNNTLHGKTGLKKIEVPVTGFESFDPFKSAIAFKEGTLKIIVQDAPQFRLGDQTYGPYKNRQVELPTAAALLLLCKGMAKVKGER